MLFKVDGELGKKKQKKGKNARKAELSDEALEGRARAALARGRFREACDAFKLLNKRIPHRYEAELAEAYTGRFDGFLGQGMHESAGQILASLKSLLSDADYSELRMRLARATGNAADLAPQLWSQLVSSDTSPEETAGCASNLLLLESEPSENLREHPEVRAFQAVRAGLKALCAGDQAALTASLRKIPRTSALASWKILLRGWNAWYAGDDERVDAVLARLPESGCVVGRLSDALRLLRSPDRSVEPAVVSLALALGGIGDDAKSMLKIDDLAAAGSLVEAFECGLKRLPGFLEVEQGPVAALSDYYLTAFKNEDGRLGAFEHEIGSRLMRGQFPAAVARRLMRVGYGVGFVESDPDLLLNIHGFYLRRLRETDSSEALLARLCIRTVQRMLAVLKRLYRVPPIDLLMECETLLVEAAEMDPEYSDAGLLLAEVYELSGKKSERNRLLDRLAADFPENPSILLLAGRRCIERKTFGRGLAHLRKAIELDPVREDLKRALADACLRQAVLYYGKGRADRARSTIDTVESHLVAPRTPPDFVLEQRWMCLWRLAMEEIHGNDEGIAAARAAVDDVWGDRPLARDVFLEFYRQCVARGKPGRSMLSASFDALSEELKPAEIVLIIQLGRYAREGGLPGVGDPRRWIGEAEVFVKNYLAKRSSERMEAVLTVLWACFEDGRLDTLPERVVIDCVRRWSKFDRTHPQLKLLQLAASYSDPWQVAVPPEDFRQLDKAEQEARKRGDEVALRRAQSLRLRLQEIERQGFVPPPGFNGIDLPDDDEPLFDGAGMFGVGDDADEMEESFEGVYEIWSTANSAERKGIEKTMRKALGKEAADDLIEGLTARKEEEAAARRSQPGPGRSGDIGPSQIELF